MEDTLSAQKQYERAIQSGLHTVSISEATMNDFDATWGQLDARMKMVPGKDVLSALNTHLQTKYKVALSVNALVGAFNQSEVPAPLAALLMKLEEMRTAEIPDQPTLSFEEI